MKKAILTLLVGLSLGLGFGAQAQVPGDLALAFVAENLKINRLDLKAIQTSDIKSEIDGREVHEVKLVHPEVGSIHFMMSGPIGFMTSNARLPVLMISAGFFSGMRTIQLLQNPSDIILVGYEYPTTKDEILKDPSRFPKMLRVVPGQMALLLEWLQSRKYIDSSRVWPMGVSLGSLFMPLALRLADMRGFRTEKTIFAFGGADITLTVKNIFREVPEPLRNALVQTMGAISALHDPRIHLPHLRGTFMTAYGTEDQVFPRKSSLKQYDLLPSPKEIHWIKGPHIDVDQPAVIGQLVPLVYQYLAK